MRPKPIALTVLTGLLPFLAVQSVLAAPTGLRRVVPRVSTSAELDKTPRDGSRLLLHGAVFDPLREEPDFAGVGLPPGGGGAYGIVQLRPGRAGARAGLERLGVRFFGYLPDNAFQVRLTPSARRLLASHPDVRWLGTYEPGFKVHARLWPGSGDPAAAVTVHVFPDASIGDVAAELLREFPSALLASMPADLAAPRARFTLPVSSRDRFVRAAARLDAVSWMEPYDAPELLNNDSLGPIQSNTATVLSAGACTSCALFQHGITGTGQIATVADTGNDSDMCYFRNLNGTNAVTDASPTTPPALGPLFPTRKVIGYFTQPAANPYDTNGPCNGSFTVFHGTHTSGIVLGDNFARPSSPAGPGIDVGDGMAPNAQLLFQDIGDVNGCLNGLIDPYAMYQQARDGGARVHSNSYGSGTAGAYQTEDQIADRFLFDNEQMAIFFAAGNSGGVRTTYSPGNAKNVVTVGALGHGNDAAVAGFSSRGPAADGRIKPDLAAPGVFVVSAGGDANHTDANCTTTTLSGTSMATPTAAGGAALLRQYFADGFYPTGGKSAADSLDAPAPLVKATLLNGTLPLPAGGAFGNGDYGWGRVFLDSNLYFAGDARRLRVWDLANGQGLTTGQTDTYIVSAATGQELRVTLVWSDPEATLGAATTLVNNLDLAVTNGAATYRGNLFDATGASITGGAPDVTNNVEQVRLPAPNSGVTAITVNASAVPGNGRGGTNRQGYALVVSGALCATAVASAPAGPAAIPNAIMGVDLGWTNAPGSSTTQVYRAAGTCGAPAGDFQYVGSSAGTTFTDARAEGGFTYAYRLRGADACGEGPASSCVTVVPTGRCDLPPTFAGLSSITQDATNCRLVLTWPAATSSCPAAPLARYDVYRSTSPNFLPTPFDRIATVTATTFADDTVAPNTTYYYVVRAEDGTTGGSGPNGGNQETNGKQLFATALGPPGSPGTWTDDGGDTNAYLTNEPPWQVTATDSQAGTRSYHSGPDAGTYPNSTCAALTTPPLSLQSGSLLTYWVRYNLEYQWDGVVVEISTDGGSNWTDLPPTNPPGYPGTLSLTQNPPINACAYPATHDAFTGPTGNGGLTPWSQVQTNLSPAYSGQTVKIRWRFTSDPGLEYQGFFLDTISVTNVNLPGSCGAVVNPAPAIVSLSPAARYAGSAAFTLSVNGSGFTGSSVVEWNGSPRITTYVSPALVTARVGAADIAGIGPVPVTVVNPAPGGGTSTAATFNVCAPLTLTAGNSGPVCPGQTLTLTASPVPGATYQWTGPNGFMATGASPSIPGVTGASQGTYLVTADTGCGPSDPAATYVIVNADPAPPAVTPPAAATVTQTTCN